MARLRKISEQRPRWGYRRAHGHLLTEGLSVNRKRVQRIWREEGLRVPAKAKKRNLTFFSSSGLAAGPDWSPSVKF